MEIKIIESSGTKEHVLYTLGLDPSVPLFKLRQIEIFDSILSTSLDQVKRIPRVFSCVIGVEHTVLLLFDKLTVVELVYAHVS